MKGFLGRGKGKVPAVELHNTGEHVKPTNHIKPPPSAVMEPGVPSEAAGAPWPTAGEAVPRTQAEWRSRSSSC